MLIHPITGRRANVRQRNDSYLNVTKDNYSLIDWIHSHTFCCCCKACVLFAADSKMKPLLTKRRMKLHKFDWIRFARRGTARHTRAQQGYRLSCLVALGTSGAWTKLKSALSDLPYTTKVALGTHFGQRNVQVAKWLIMLCVQDKWIEKMKHKPNVFVPVIVRACFVLVGWCPVRQVWTEGEQVGRMLVEMGLGLIATGLHDIISSFFASEKRYKKKQNAKEE